MANNEQVAPLARATLIAGMTMAFEAIDPTTGAPVAGVKIDQAAIYGDDTGDSATVPVVIKPDVAPLWAPTPTVGEEAA